MPMNQPGNGPLDILDKVSEAIQGGYAPGSKEYYAKVGLPPSTFLSRFARAYTGKGTRSPDEELVDTIGLSFLQSKLNARVADEETNRLVPPTFGEAREQFGPGIIEAAGGRVPVKTAETIGAPEGFYESVRSQFQPGQIFGLQIRPPVEGRTQLDVSRPSISQSPAYQDILDRRSALHETINQTIEEGSYRGPFADELSAARQGLIDEVVQTPLGIHAPGVETLRARPPLPETIQPVTRTSRAEDINAPVPPLVKRNIITVTDALAKQAAKDVDMHEVMRTGKGPAAVINKLIEEQGKTSREGIVKGEQMHNTLLEMGANPAAPTRTDIASARKLIEQRQDVERRRDAVMKAGTERQNAMASLHGKELWSDLTLGEKTDVLNLEEQRTVRIEQAKTKAEKQAILEAAEDAPLNEHAPSWLDQNGNAAPAAISRREARTRGYTPVTQQQMAAVQSGRAALAALADYKKIIDQVLVSRTGNTWVDFVKVQGNKALLTAREMAGDPLARRFEELAANLAVFAKALGDTGNVAVAEQLMRLAGLPNKSDTAESAWAVYTQLDNRLRNMIRARGVPIGDDEIKKNEGARKAIEQAKEEMRREK